MGQSRQAGGWKWWREARGGRSRRPRDSGSPDLQPRRGTALSKTATTAASARRRDSGVRKQSQGTGESGAGSARRRLAERRRTAPQAKARGEPGAEAPSELRVAAGEDDAVQPAHGRDARAARQEEPVARQQKGYDLLPYLPLLFAPKMTDEAWRVKADYYADVWSGMFRHTFFQVQAEWCAKNNLEYLVHLNHEEWMLRLASPEDLIRNEGDYPGVSWRIFKAEATLRFYS